MSSLATLIYTFFKGVYVGHDAFGNRYYCERSFFGKKSLKRWVIYQGIAEPSKIPAIWHSWLHYTTDEPLVDEPYAWQKPHQPNLTGTKGAYFPEKYAQISHENLDQSLPYEPWDPSSPS